LEEGKEEEGSELKPKRVKSRKKIVSSDSQSKVDQETSSSPPSQPKLLFHYLRVKRGCCKFKNEIYLINLKNLIKPF